MASAQGPAFQDAALFCFRPAADDGLSGEVNHGFKTGDRLGCQRLQWIPGDLAFTGLFYVDSSPSLDTAPADVQSSRSDMSLLDAVNHPVISNSDAPVVSFPTKL